MADYITLDYLGQRLDVTDKDGDARGDAITSASLEFDRYAGVMSGYFANTSNYATVPADVQTAVRKLAIADLRGSDPLSLEAAGLTSADIKALRDSAKDIAFAYKRDIEVARESGIDDDLPYISQNVEVRRGWL